MRRKASQLASFLRSYRTNGLGYDYWHCPHVASDLVSAGGYFIDFSPKADYLGPFDEDGTPLLDLATQHWSRHVNTVYAPIVTAQWGLGHHSLHLRGDPTAADKVVVAAQAMRRRALETPIGLVITCDYGDGPVRSAMAQGLAVSLWKRAHELTGRPDWARSAYEAFRVLDVPIAEGGVLDRTGDLPVLQEWTNERHHILNGHLFAFAGIAEARRLPLSPQEREVVTSSYVTHLSSSLTLAGKSDLGFWTRYSLERRVVPNIASHFYHKLHVEMARGLTALTGDVRFAALADRWERQRRSRTRRALALAAKLADRMEVEIRRLSRGRRPRPGGTP